MSYKSIAALGDSITNGFWDETFQGWFGRLAEKISKKHPFTGIKGKPRFGFHNLSMDGDRVCDAFHRLAAEGCSREDFDVLLIKIGGNDVIRSPNPDSPMDLSEHVREEYWHKLLTLAKKNSETVIVLDILPRHKDDTIAYGWFDAPMHEYNADRVAYNDQIANICATQNIPFIRMHDKWAKRDLSKYYVDTSHPNGAGHQLIADEVFEELEKMGIV